VPYLGRQIDVAATAFGTCKCGRPKADHDLSAAPSRSSSPVGRRTTNDSFVATAGPGADCDDGGCEK